jgi:hypothetical protein
MLAMRLQLTDRLQANSTVQDLGVHIIQEDELSKDSPLPAVVIAYDGKRPYKASETFFRERWILYILTHTGDYYTIGKIGDALRRDLHRTYLDSPTGERDAGLEIEWVLDGPTQQDATYNMHTQVQYYEIITQMY